MSQGSKVGRSCSDCGRSPNAGRLVFETSRLSAISPFEEPGCRTQSGETIDLARRVRSSCFIMSQGKPGGRGSGELPI